MSKNINKKEKATGDGAKKNFKRIIAAICAIAVALGFLLFSLAPAFSVSAASAADKAKAARDSAKKELENIKNEKADLVSEFANFDAQLTAAEDKVAALSSAIEATKTEIENKEKELEEAQKNTDTYKEEFKKRARIMYENGSTSYLEVLFGAKSFSDFIEKVEIVGSIVSYDREVLNRFVENQLIIKNAKNEKEALLLKQQDDMKGLEYRQEELQVLLEKQQALIEKITQDEGLAQKALAAAEKKYEEEQRKAQEEIDRQLALKKNQPVNVTYKGGKFAWPAPSGSRISSPFGYRKHPISGTRRYHSGIDIPTAYGTNIIAAEAGTVIVAKYESGYGRYVVINHGNGYTTLYGHNSQLLVSAGQSVSRGQVIAKAGSTGMSTGPHCHFEVRYNGVRQNPLNYLN